MDATQDSSFSPPPAPPLWVDRAVPTAFAFLALTILMTFPLAFQFRSHVPAGAVDLWQNYWNFWWWKKCLLELHRHPYSTNFLFWPSGAELIFYTHSAFNMIVGLPATILWGPGAAYNFCLLLALWLSGWGAYLLARELTGDGRGAFLAGVVFAYFPQHQDQTLEHLNLFSTQFIPLTLFFFLQVKRAGGWGNVFGAGICFALNALTDWHLGIFLTLALIPTVVAALIRPPRPRGRLLFDFILAALLATLLTLPLVWSLLGGLIGGDNYFQKLPEDRGIDPTFLFIPTFHHPLWGRFLESYYVKHRAYDAAGFICYLGFVPVGLAIFALIRRQKGAIFWSLFFLGSLLLALGARPWWNGMLIENVALPFAIFAKIPLLSFLRIANRFLILGSLALAVLTALGWQGLREKTDAKFLLLCASILLEYLWTPFPTQKLEISPYYAQMAEEKRKGAVLDIPFTPDGMTVFNMRAQTIHNRPIAGGYLSTLPPAPRKAIEDDASLSDLVGLDPPLKHPIDANHLRELGFSTIILHKDRAESYAKNLRPKNLFEGKLMFRIGGISDETFARIRRALEEACGKPVYEDKKDAPDPVVVFYLPDNHPNKRADFRPASAFSSVAASRKSRIVHRAPALRRASGASVVATPQTFAPAARADSIPTAESSKTRHSEGEILNRAAIFSKGSGWGLGRLTCSAPIKASKRFRQLKTSMI